MKYILFLLFFVACSSFEKEKPVYFINPNPPSAFEKIAEALSRKEGENTAKPNKTIVLNFTNIEGKEHGFGKVFAEKLTTELVKQKKFIVLDRMIYSKKIQESGLSLSANVEPVFLKRMGDAIGVDYVIVGLVIPAKSSGYDINCRLIDIRTGLIIAAEEGFYAESNE